MVSIIKVLLVFSLESHNPEILESSIFLFIHISLTLFAQQNMIKINHF